MSKTRKRKAYSRRLSTRNVETVISIFDNAIDGEACDVKEYAAARNDRTALAFHDDERPILFELKPLAKPAWHRCKREAYALSDVGNSTGVGGTAYTINLALAAFKAAVVKVHDVPFTSDGDRVEYETITAEEAADVLSDSILLDIGGYALDISSPSRTVELRDDVGKS